VAILVVVELLDFEWLIVINIAFLSIKTVMSSSYILVNTIIMLDALLSDEKAVHLGLSSQCDRLSVSPK
jgi:hypothetical protein